MEDPNRPSGSGHGPSQDVAAVKAAAATNNNNQQQEHHVISLSDAPIAGLIMVALLLQLLRWSMLPPCVC